MQSNIRLTIKKNKKILLIALFVSFLLFLYSIRINDGTDIDYDYRPYKYQETYQKYSVKSSTYKIVIVADKDKASYNKEQNTWDSVLRYGNLKRDTKGMYSVEWTEERNITSKYNDGKRGMELSDLCYFNNKLYTFDDRTGIVYEITEESIVPLHILTDGDGTMSQGFKGEWCAVVDDRLYIGGIGKEWTTASGELVHYGPMWVKSIDTYGRVEHHNWKHIYVDLRASVDVKYPGYLLHEAVAFTYGAQVGGHTHKKWLFLPRRLSKEPYDAEKDEYRCANVALFADVSFEYYSVTKNIGPLEKTRGFSTVKFIPFRENEFIALKTEEVGGISTYMSVFDIDGRVLMPEIKIASEKFEGIEFI
eukprot:TRINITY_DN4780_c1_g1_i4.p1 TRINITY_DN4780_c1_g1~~TRINITY_DN4780_c1_g1_i4.p1  ORF type:complete len:363 (+),score=110.71 TRINITY_DN4780_c1_g1_i4:1204-2292(+)